MLDEVTQRITDLTSIEATRQYQIAYTLFVIVALWLVRALVLRLVWRRTDDVRSRYIWRKSSTYVTAAVMLACIALIWVEAIQSLSTFFGLLSAGLAIALRDPVTNIAGWAYIVGKRPFSVGDRIQSGEHAGDVIDISMFHFTLMEIGNWVDADQSTGRVIHVPNSAVFTLALANYSQGFHYIWNEIAVLVTFESNWEKAKELLQGIADEHSEHKSALAAERVKEASRRFMIFYSALTPKVYTSVKDSGVMLTVRYLAEPRRRRGTEEAIWEEILRAFAACDDVDFAYPTRRFYNNATEGKAGTRPDRAEPQPPSEPVQK